MMGERFDDHRLVPSVLQDRVHPVKSHGSAPTGAALAKARCTAAIAAARSWASDSTITASCRRCSRTASIPRLRTGGRPPVPRSRRPAAPPQSPRRAHRRASRRSPPRVAGAPGPGPSGELARPAHLLARCPPRCRRAQAEAPGSSQATDTSARPRRASARGLRGAPQSPAEAREATAPARATQAEWTPPRPPGPRGRARAGRGSTDPAIPREAEVGRPGSSQLSPGWFRAWDRASACPTPGSGAHAPRGAP
jgi:hypothetical protein